jgi:hypothetical protein
VAQFNLKQTLANISPGLPPGFDPSKGIRSLFPPVWSGSITQLSNYHFSVSDSLHAVGVHCDYTVDVWGGGGWHFFGVLKNEDVINADYSLIWTFNFTKGTEAFGVDENGHLVALDSHHFDFSGNQEWIRNIWPEAFASGWHSDLKVDENIDTLLDILLPPIVVAVYLFGGHAYVKNEANKSWVLNTNPPPP